MLGNAVWWYASSSESFESSLGRAGMCAPVKGCAHGEDAVWAGNSASGAAGRVGWRRDTRVIKGLSLLLNLGTYGMFFSLVLLLFLFQVFVFLPLSHSLSLLAFILCFVVFTPGGKCSGYVPTVYTHCTLLLLSFLP